MADINLKKGNTDFVNISEGDVTIGNQAQTVGNDEIVLDTPIVNQVISNTDIETTDDVPEGTSNLYYTDARVDARINEADIVLDDVYTNADFDTQLATKTTSHLTEGSNLYYTDARSRLAISVQGDLTYDNTTGVLSYNTPTVSNDVNSVNSQTGVVVLDTSHIAENTNLYYTDTRARQSISATGDISYNNTTGVISFTANTSPVTSVNTLTGAVVLNTDSISEGTNNLYYTDTRSRQAISVSGDLSYDNSTGVISFTETPQTSDVNSVNSLTGVVTLDTDNISEGTTNLYYTDARVDARAQLKIDSILDSAPGSLDTLNELANALGDDPNFATTMTNNLALKLNITDFNSTFDTQLATKTTTNIAEGTNLYFTDARVDTHLNTANAVGGQILNWNGTDYTWVTPTTYTAYTNSDVDTHLNTSSATSNQVLSWDGSDYNWTTVTGFDGQFSSLTGKPSTLAGYGIFDALPLTDMEPRGNIDLFYASSINFNNVTVQNLTYGDITGAVPVQSFPSLTQKPTTLQGYGVSNAIYNDSNVAAQPVRQYYASQSSFPTASAWHGAMAHSHSDGAMYYAHNNVWNKLANDSDLKNNLSELNDVTTSTIDNGYLVYSALSGTHNTQALHISHDTSPELGGNLDTNSQSINGGLKLADGGIIETFDNISGSATTVTLNLNTSHSLFITGATNNKTLALTNLSLSNTEATNITVIWDQGSTPYMINNITINGLGAYINWQGGSQPSGTASGKDIISFSIYSTGSSYFVMGQSVSYS